MPDYKSGTTSYQDFQSCKTSTCLRLLKKIVILQIEKMLIMKKLILFALCIAMGGALFAQSKSELKEQLDALTAQVETLKSDLNNSIQERNQLQKTMTAERNQLQSTINLLEEKIAALNTTINMQNTTLASYADQVARLNNEIANLTNPVVGDSSRHAPAPMAASQNYPRERIVFFSNSKNNTFTVPEGKTWDISSGILLSTANKYVERSPKVYITDWNSKKLNNYEISYGTIPEKTTIKLQIIMWNGNNYGIGPNDAEGYIFIKEYDNE